MIEHIAQGFALCAHLNQMYGKRPYSEHLKETAAIAEKLNLSRNVIAACWLHDTIEDQGILIADLYPIFGEAIALAVWATTEETHNAGGCKYKNRKERKAATYPKTAKNPDAILVKLCDRIANIEACEKDNHELLKMYLDESPEFVAALHQYTLGSPPIWEYYFRLIERLQK